MERKLELMDRLTELNERYDSVIMSGKVITSADLEAVERLKNEAKGLNTELCGILSQDMGYEVTHSTYEFWVE